MDSLQSPLLPVAQSYIVDSANGADQESQDIALAALEKLLNGTCDYAECRVVFEKHIKNTVALDKIQSILTVDENPLPPLDEEANAIPNNSMPNSFPQKIGGYSSNSSFSRKRKLNPWEQCEDIRLLAAIHKYGFENWVSVAKFVGHSRTRAQCSQRWNRGLDPHLRKCRWTPEEEEKLKELIVQHGLKAWTQIAQKLGNRSDVQCRYHYNQMLKQSAAVSSTANGSNTSSNAVNLTLNKNNAHALPMSPLPTPFIHRTDSAPSVTNERDSAPNSPNNTLNDSPHRPTATVSFVQNNAPNVLTEKASEDNSSSMNFVPDFLVSPEISLGDKHNSHNLMEIFDNAWDVSYAMNDINDDLFLAFESNTNFLTDQVMIQDSIF
ncbi:Myb-like DNA-binding domain containing protein [Tritrichomonas foetus]|uniref:Myb-like DNA-binding domain containing protein n=1 Tax=Tritrichomonas foetus TaxID=1144522 RepID=A0A1J4KPG9_9EUKA|nr:Myb-like DNA-binding domain containing protein [Tritrichomonas foetus]|eukprot:OHT13002.1 Myb-like DNA-binding domain containing protein [Tritrichomonas foetus]